MRFHFFHFQVGLDSDLQLFNHFSRTWTFWCETDVNKSPKIIFSSLSSKCWLIIMILRAIFLFRWSADPEVKIKVFWPGSRNFEPTPGGGSGFLTMVEILNGVFISRIWMRIPTWPVSQNQPDLTRVSDYGLLTNGIRISALINYSWLRIKIQEYLIRLNTVEFTLKYTIMTSVTKKTCFQMQSTKK